MRGACPLIYGDRPNYEDLFENFVFEQVYFY